MPEPRRRPALRLTLIAVATPPMFVGFILVWSRSQLLAYGFAFVAAVALTSFWIKTVLDPARAAHPTDVPRQH